MKKIRHSIVISAPREKVWEIMLGKDTYKQWTKVFNPTSDYIGTWEEGSEIRFVGTDEATSQLGGMYSRIKENRLHEFISIEHIGFILGDTIDTESEEVRKWAGALENYTFTDVEGGTQVTVDQDIDESYQEMFEEMWPKGLSELKRLCEAE